MNAGVAVYLAGDLSSSQGPYQWLLAIFIQEQTYLFVKTDTEEAPTIPSIRIEFFGLSV